MISASIDTANEIEKRKLQLDSKIKNQVLRLKRVRLIEEVPVMWDIFTMPECLPPDFPLDDVPERLYIYLESAQLIYLIEI